MKNLKGAQRLRPYQTTGTVSILNQCGSVGAVLLIVFAAVAAKPIAVKRSYAKVPPSEPLR